MSLPDAEPVRLFVIHSNDFEGISRTTSVIANAFRNDPISIAMICDVDRYNSTASTTSLRQIPSHRVLNHFRPRIQEHANAASTIVQVGNWSVVAIWKPPVDNAQPCDGSEVNRSSGSSKPTSSAFPIGLQEEFETKSEEVRRRHLTNPQTSIMRSHYYLDLLARNPNIPSVSGAISAVMNSLLELARKDSVPVWLKSTPHAMDLYAHFGFRTVEGLTVGTGRYNAEGWPVEEGEGVTVYAMIYDAHLQK